MNPFAGLQCELGECPVWDDRRGALFLQDIIRCRLIRVDLASGSARETPLPALGGGMALTDAGLLRVAVQTGLFDFDPETERWEHLGPIGNGPDQRPNEGKADHRGNFWIGTMSTLGRFPTGSLRSFRNRAMREHLGGVSVPNCLVFDHLRRRMFFTDSVRRTIWTFDHDPDAPSLGDAIPFFDLQDLPGIPDGGALDAEGCLWVALFGGGQVIRLSPAGELIGAISLPVSQVTSLAFCGPELDRIAVTTAKRLLDDGERRAQPWAGDLFLLEAGTKGVLPYRVAD